MQKRPCRISDRGVSFGLLSAQLFLSNFSHHKENRPCSKATGAVRDKCLTMTYSHMEKLHTTIGAKR
ncbi:MULTISPECIES: hypothetical protein, partial [unclassified Cobetia]|uniref:hypothetical protein n=1 Tax=unclassified Cobetia TaxID=2609414 RepID=UPI002097286A